MSYSSTCHAGSRHRENCLLAAEPVLSDRSVVSRHQRSQVLRLQERWRRRRAPVVQAAHAFHYGWLPQLVIDNAIQIGVVLGEIAGRILQVPEEVRSDV